MNKEYYILIQEGHKSIISYASESELVIKGYIVGVIDPCQLCAIGMYVTYEKTLCKKLEDWEIVKYKLLGFIDENDSK